MNESTLTPEERDAIAATLTKHHERGHLMVYFIRERMMAHAMKEGVVEFERFKGQTLPDTLQEITNDILFTLIAEIMSVLATDDEDGLRFFKGMADEAYKGTSHLCNHKENNG